MARWTEPTEHQMRLLAHGFSPEKRACIERYGFEPWKLYRLKTTGLRGARCTIVAFRYAEGVGVTLDVLVNGQFNLVLIDRVVVGVRPDDLEECELPAPGEQLGTLCGLCITAIRPEDN